MKEFIAFLKKQPKGVLIVLVGFLATAVVSILQGEASTESTAESAWALLSFAVALFLYWGYAQFSQEPKKYKAVAYIFGYSLIASIPFVVLSVATIYIVSWFSLPLQSESMSLMLLLALPEMIAAAYVAGIIGEYVSGRKISVSYPLKFYLRLLAIFAVAWVVEFALAFFLPEVATYAFSFIQGLASAIAYLYAIYWFSVIAPPAEEDEDALAKAPKPAKKAPLDDLDRLAAARADIARAREELKASTGGSVARDEGKPTEDM